MLVAIIVIQEAECPGYSPGDCLVGSIHSETVKDRPEDSLATPRFINHHSQAPYLQDNSNTATMLAGNRIHAIKARPQRTSVGQTWCSTKQKCHFYSDIVVYHVYIASSCRHHRSAASGFHRDRARHRPVYAVYWTQYNYSRGDYEVHGLMALRLVICTALIAVSTTFLC